jgi:hypothetical protein
MDIKNSGSRRHHPNNLPTPTTAMCDTKSPATQDLRSCACFSCNKYTPSHERFKSGVFERTALEANGIYNATRSTLCKQHFEKLVESAEKVYWICHTIKKDEKKDRKPVVKMEKSKVNVNAGLY